MSSASTFLHRVRSLATHDFSPEMSRRVRRAVASPLGVLLIAAGVAGLIGLVLHPRVFVLAAGLLGMAAVGVCWPWVTSRGTRASVRAERPRATEGEAVDLSARVVNHLPWPARGLLLRLDEAEAGGVRVGSVSGRTRNAFRWSFTPAVRGEYPLHPPTLGTAFPFGLWVCKRAVEVERPLLVWPRTYPVGPVPTADGEAAVEGRVARNRVGSTGDVLGVRPYRRGDSPRRIHWPQSARHDRLVVCELQSTSRPVVTLVLDLDPRVHSAGSDGTREWAIRVVASLAVGWLDAGAQVGVVWDGFALPPRAGAEQFTRILDALARIPPEGRSIIDVCPQLPRDGMTVLVTTDASPECHRGGGAVRRVVLCRDGFGGEATARPTGRAWLTLPSADRVPHLLRHGTAEASHGS